MLDSLRTRFVLSHALPILILLPLIGFVLLYLLETRYFLVNLANEMVVEAALIGEILEANPAVWSDADSAAQSVGELQEQFPRQLPYRIMLLNSEGDILASSLGADADRIGRPVGQDLERRALAGEVVWDLQYSFGLGERVVDVAVPVVDAQDRLLGVVRISHSLAQIEERLIPLRWFVLVTFAAGVAVAVALSVVLAGSLSSSLLRLSAAVAGFSTDAPPQQLPVSGSREMRTLIAQYNDMAQRLYDLEVSRRRLLAGIVHEVGRPLGGIYSAAQLLSRRSQPDPQLVQELALEIEDEAHNIRQQIDDLVLLAQSDRGTLLLEKEEVDLEELFFKRCAHLIARMRKDGLAIDIQFAPDLPRVHVDPPRITQVLCNLLDNARKYSPAGGTIAVEADVEHSAANNPMVAVRVSDSGPGIVPDEQDKIFNFFYRSADQSHRSEGMGIGLALSQQLAVAHGGTLQVQSTPGQGATFILRVPVYTTSP